MGERNACCLNIWGISDRQPMETVLREICLWEGTSPKDIEWMLEGRNKPYFDFEEVNEGRLDPAVHQVLQETGLGYSWEIGSSREHNHLVEIYNPLTGKHLSYTTDGRQILLSLEDAGDPEKLALAKETQNFWRSGTSLGLAVTSSAHQYMEILEQHPGFQPYAAATSKRTDEQIP